MPAKLTQDFCLAWRKDFHTFQMLTPTPLNDRLAPTKVTPSSATTNRLFVTREFQSHSFSSTTPSDCYYRQLAPDLSLTPTMCATELGNCDCWYLLTYRYLLSTSLLRLCMSSQLFIFI